MESPESTPPFFRPNDGLEINQGHLPHWRQEGTIYFVTFRLSDSLPKGKLAEWAAQRNARLSIHPPPHDAKTQRDYFDRFPNRLHRWLDAGSGSCLLRLANARLVVEDCLRHFDGERYELDALVVAGNHAHILVQPAAGHELSRIVHTWKSYTAHELLKRTRDGRLPNVHFDGNHVWQRESFDHIVRRPASLEKIRAYIRRHRK